MDIQYHIFLSYSRKDIVVMQQIRDDLRALGLTVWTDERLEAGTPAWETAIATAIKSSGCVVVILSPDSAQSPWVGRELAFAETFDIRIFPLLVRGDERTAIPFRLISYQWVDGRYNYQHAFTTISTTIRNYAQKMTLPTTAIENQIQTTHLPEPVIIEPLWAFETQDEIRGTPVVYENTVFVGSYDSYLYALELETGKIRWKYATEAAISASPMIAEDEKSVIFGSEDQIIYAINCQTGRLLWSFSTKGRIRSTPCIAHGHVFLGCDDGKLYALNVKNGRCLWSYDGGSPVRVQPFVTMEHIYFGAENGDLTCLDLAGKTKWRFKAHLGKAFTASPFVHEQEGIVYAASMGGRIYACNAQNGRVIWEHSIPRPIASSPLYHQGRLYFGSIDGSLYTLNAKDGYEKWKFVTTKPITAAPIIVENAVYIGSTDGNFYCIQVKTGVERWRFQNKAAFMGSAQAVGDKILVGSLDSCLYALPLQPPDKPA